MTVIITLLIICLVTIVHEFGHFIAARLNGVKVEEFAVGMGPKIFGFKPGETVYSLRMFPIGGSCRMLGEDADAEDPRAFNKKSVPRRMSIILAGVFMNYVLALVITFSFLLGNYYLEPVVSSVSPGMPAEAAGILPGDRITAVDGARALLFDDVKMRLMTKTGGSPVEITVERGGDKLTKSITPVLTDGEYRIGVGAGSFAYGPFYGARGEGRVFPLSEAAAVSWHQTSAYVKLVADGLYGMVSGRISPREAAGPIYMGKIIEDTNNEILTSETVQNKPLTIFWTMLQFAAVISANLAVVNLLPIPALDGGRFVILAIEGIRRKPLNPERVGMVTFVSFAVLMLLAAAVAFSDILKLAA